MFLGLLLCNAACVTPPQTRREFVDAVKQGGHSSVRTESYVVSRDLNAVVASLERRADQCLARSIDCSGMVGGSVEVSGATYLPTINRVSTDHVEFTLQLENHPSGTGKVPPGGLYVLAEDLSSDGGGTRVDAYVPSAGFDDVVEAIRDWIEGRESRKCPELP